MTDDPNVPPGMMFANSAATRVTRWADSAMYAAEPVAADRGPRVYLLSATPDPLGTIAAAGLLYQGKVVRDKSQVLYAERRDFLEQLQKTKIKAPLEFVQFHFLIEGVTRGFTHQMVRQRTATFVQESTRFAVKEDVPVGLPPSLAGTRSLKEQWDEAYEASLTEWSESTGQHPKEWIQEYMQLHGSPQDAARRLWDTARNAVEQSYRQLTNTGMPAEDARGLLPTNVLTRIHYSTDLRALLDHAGNRLCTQAQFEWRLVFAKMAEAIRLYNPFAAHARGMCDPGVAADIVDSGHADAWQWEAIADLLRPVCYATGKCEFMASFDRACSIRERVQARATHGGVDSAQWHKPFVYNDFDPVTGHQTVPTSSPGIRATEWLLDPGAAR